MIRVFAAKRQKGMWIKNHLSTSRSLRFQQPLIVIFGVKRYNYGGYAHFHILYYVLLRSNTFLYRSHRQLKRFLRADRCETDFISPPQLIFIIHISSYSDIIGCARGFFP